MLYALEVEFDFDANNEKEQRFHDIHVETKSVVEKRIDLILASIKPNRKKNTQKKINRVFDILVKHFANINTMLGLDIEVKISLIPCPDRPGQLWLDTWKSVCSVSP